MDNNSVKSQVTLQRMYKQNWKRPKNRYIKREDDTIGTIIRINDSPAK